MRRYVAAMMLAAATFSDHAVAWDPIGDLTNPGRIIRNVERELGNVGEAVDRTRREAQVQAGAPIFETWLTQSRNTASAGAQPVPFHIRQQLTGFYPDHILNRARYKVGDAGVFNLANLSIRYGGAGAVALIDVIVFSNPNDAQFNAVLWAHELKHLEQFSSWGTRDFAIRYLRDWNAVEAEAYAAQNQFQSRIANVPPPSAAPWPPTPQTNAPNFPTFPVNSAAVCATPMGFCPMGVGVPPGSQCFCPSPTGPIWGFAR